MSQGPRRMRRNHALLPAALLGGGVGAVIGFAVLARKVRRHRTRHLDATVRNAMPKRHRRATRIAAESITPLGKWYGHMSVAGLVAAATWRSRGPRAAIPIASASAAAASLAWLTERVMRQRTPPPGRHSPTEPSFPSGHALQTGAVAWAMAYVLVREGLASPVRAVPLAVVFPAVSGLAKLWLDRHWFTDVLAGYLLGGAVAASSAAAYEWARPRRRPRFSRAILRLAR
jgi:membrane-associated phospholipid phosphatase